MKRYADFCLVTALVCCGGPVGLFHADAWSQEESRPARPARENSEDDRDVKTDEDRPRPGPPEEGGRPNGRRGFGFFGGPGGPGAPDRELVKKFDTNKNGYLEDDERSAARKEAKETAPRRPFGRPNRGGPADGPPIGPPRPDGEGPPPPRDFGPPDGPPGLPPDGPPEFGAPDGPPGPPPNRGEDSQDAPPRGRGEGPDRGPPPEGGFPFPGAPGFFGGRGGEQREPPKPGPKVDVDEVEKFPNAKLYDPDVLRTLFLEFDHDDWEDELADFYRTDVEVPATLIVDGKKYPLVGVQFRGMSSYFTVGKGYKRSLNISLDMADGKQRLYGYKTLNLLNAHEDPSFLHTVLYSQIARKHLPAPQANFVRLVVNGESWGVYVNAQQFDAQFLRESYGDASGARWKVPGSPGGGGGLDYRGDKVEAYKSSYQLKGKDDPKAWGRLVELCRILDTTPPEKLEEALRPILDLEETLWFLAVDCALINSDGYWIRGSDFSLYLDNKQRFHILPHDMNEAFQPPMGPGMFRPFGGRRNGRPPAEGEVAQPAAEAPKAPGLDLDPLIGLDDPRKPLRSKLLNVPELRASYLNKIRAIAQDDLDWTILRPVVRKFHEQIAIPLELDTRKLSTLEAFEQAIAEEAAPVDGGPALNRGRRPRLSLKAFFEGRREFLLSHPQVNGTKTASLLGE